MSLFTRPSESKVDQAFSKYASNHDGTLTFEDCMCAVRYLTGQRLSPSSRLEATRIIDVKGSIDRPAFRCFVDDAWPHSGQLTTLDDLWQDMTGDPQACVKKKMVVEWIVEAMGRHGYSGQIAEQLWQELDPDDTGFVGVRDIKRVLEE